MRNRRRLPWEQEVPIDLRQQSAVRVFCVDHNLAEAGLSQFAGLPDLQRPYDAEWLGADASS
jgi:hypothetical protein